MAELLTPPRDRLMPVERESLPAAMSAAIASPGYSASLSADQQTVTDVLSQVYRGTSVVRMAPLPPSASATSNAAANSAAQVIVAAAAAAVPAAAATSAQKIPVNPQAGTQYTVAVGDLGKLDTFSNNSGGTIVLPGGSLLPNRFSAVEADTGAGATLTASVTPYFANSAVFFIGSCSAYTFQAGIVPSGSGWAAIDAAANANYASIYTKLIPGVSSITETASITATAWVESLLVFQNVNKLPTVVQSKILGSGAFITGESPSGAFNNPVTKGNLILVLVSVGSITNDISGNPTSASITVGDGTNSYGVVVDGTGSQDGGHSGPQSGYSCQQLVAIAENVAGGSTTVTVNITIPGVGSAIGAATITAYEISLGTAPASLTGFTPGWYCYIQNTGSGSFSVTSDVNIDGSASPVSLGSGSGLIVAFDGTNWFTERGDGGGGGSVSSLNSLTGALDITAGTGLTITPSGSNVEVSFSGTTGSGSVVQATGPTLSNPIVGTQTPLDDSTKAASTAYVDTAISTAIGSGAAPLSYFFYGATAGDVTSAAWTNAALSGTTNAVILWYFVLPYTVKFKKISFYVTLADGTNNYDFGIYNLSGTLLANLGAAEYASTGSVTTAIAQTEVTLAAGAYFFAITSNAAGSLALEFSTVTAGTEFYVIGNSLTTTPIWFTSATVSSGGALPASITAPTISAASNLVNWRTNTSTAVGKPIFVLTDF